MGVETEYSEITWEGLLTSLDTGTVDLVLNQVGVTPERTGKNTISAIRICTAISPDYAGG